MTPTPTAAQPIEDLLAQLQALGAAQYDPVGWHYLQTLAERSRAASGAAQALLRSKLQQALEGLQAKMPSSPHPALARNTPAAPSPLATLLQDIAQRSPNGQTASWRAESPRTQQFRQQLGKIRVQKQVAQAIAQAPQNAGPINSHMLVLRSLGLMRDISPDYLNRFMVYIDTLLCLDGAGQGKTAPKKTSANPAEK